MKSFRAIIIVLIFFAISLPAIANDRIAHKYNQLGFTYQKQGNYNKALEEYNKALNVDPGFFAAQSNVGTLYYLMGDYKRSAEYYERAMKLNPKSFAAHYSMGLALISYLKDTTEETYRPDLYSNTFKLRAVRGSSVLLNQAINELEIAKNIAPKVAKVHTALGIAYSLNKQKVQAEEEFKTAYKLNNNDPTNCYYLGLILSKKGDSTAVQYLEKTIKLDPGFSKAYIELARIYNDRNDKQNAMKYAQKGLNLFKKDAFSVENNVVVVNVSRIETPIRYQKQLKEGNNDVYSTYKSPIVESDEDNLNKLVNKIQTSSFISLSASENIATLND